MLKLSFCTLAPALLAGVLAAQVGSVLGTINTPAGVVPVGLGADAAGDLHLTATNGTIYKLDRNGNVLLSWSAAANTGIPNGVATDGTNFFVTDASTLTGGKGVDVYDLAGNYVRTFPVAASFPSGISWNPTSNHVFVVDRIGGSSAYEYDLQGNQIASHTLNGSRNDGIAYDPATNSYWVYEAAGDLLRNYDSTWTETSNFPGPLAAVGSGGRGVAFVGGILYVVVPTLRQIVLFDTTGNFASVASYGRGCPPEPVVYESFAAGTLDLTGTSYLFQPNGQGGWSVVTCPQNCFDSTFGANLFLGDDQLATNQQLGFSFPMPGSPNGATSAIDVSSNGFIWLRTGATMDHGCCNGDPAALASGPERIAAAWMDLDPSGGGSVHFRATTNRAVVTWSGVPEISTRNFNTVQIQLFSNGNFILAFQQIVAQNHTVLVGYSPGDGAVDPGSIDLTAAVPFSTGPSAPRLRLDGDRPVLGTTVTYRVTEIPANATLGALIFGSQQTALPLVSIGMTGCELLSSGDLATGPINTGTGTFQIGIPNVATLTGAQLYHQAVVLTRGLNPFGAITSNGLSAKLGL